MMVVSHTESMINNLAFDEARQWYVIECFGERAVRSERRSPNPLHAAPGAARSAAGTCGAWLNRTMVADARYEPHEKFEFSITL